MKKNKGLDIYFITGFMSNGGAERVISILSNAFVNNGYKVTVLAILGDDKDYYLDERVNYLPLECSNENKFQRVLSRLHFIRKNINKSENKVVISFMAQINVYAIVANLFNRVNLVVSERNDPYQDPPSKMLRKLRDFLYNFVDQIVFQTPDAQKYFSEKIQRKSVLIANPISNEIPKPFRGERKKVIVTAARLDEQKNLKLLIDAFNLIRKEYSEYKLQIFGEGPLEKELKSYTVKLGLEKYVIFSGYSKQLHKDIIDASIFVLSSNYEGISNSLIEALALGIPVISTDHPIGGARMYIKSGYNGMLTPVGDTEALYKSLKNYIENPYIAEEYGKNATKIRSDLEVNKIIKEWESLLTQK
mgnify:CR=1 FL=1